LSQGIGLYQQTTHLIITFLDGLAVCIGYFS
jgi:hypothetical protein